MSGLITSILDKITNGSYNFKSFILEIDGKQNCRGKGKLMGDINMFEFEPDLMLNHKRFNITRRNRRKCI